MKIVHLTDSMEMGGAEKLISLLCRWQRQRGHEPSVHCLYAIGALGEELRNEGFEIISHSSAAFGGRSGSVSRALRRGKPEVVHCHNATAAILGAIPARMAGTERIVVTRHGNVDPPYTLRRELKFAFVSRWCDWVVAVCDRARSNLLAVPFATRRKIVRVFNAAVPPLSAGSRSLPKSGFTLVTVARLSPAKDQETLLRAFAIAKQGTPGLRLWIVGGGPLRNELERAARVLRIDDHVTFFGEQSDVAPFLAAADLFVLSSITEGVPVSLLEALGAGLPAVVTDVGGMGEVARLSSAVMTSPPSNPSSLARAICKMVESRDELPRLAEAARRCFVENFTLERMADEYMSLYRSAPLA